MYLPLNVILPHGRSPASGQLFHENKKSDRDGGERDYFDVGLSSVYIKKASMAHAVDAFFEMLGFGKHFNSDVDHFVQSHKRQADFGASFSFIDLFNNAFHSFKRP